MSKAKKKKKTRMQHFNPHQSAIARSKPSKPLEGLVELGFIRPGLRILDFGCGRGGDVRWLESQGYDVTGFDPHEEFGFEKEPRGLFDIVLMTYVVNVIPSQLKRLTAVRRAWDFVAPTGQLFIAARSRAEIDAARRKGKWKHYGDGYVSDPKRGIFQKGHDRADLETLLMGQAPARIVGISANASQSILAWKNQPQTKKVDSGIHNGIRRRVQRHAASAAGARGVSKAVR